MKVILNRLKAQPEEIIAEEEAGFRAERTELHKIIFKYETNLQHQ